MRIALFHNTPSGGAKRAIYEWTRRLAQYQIDVYTLGSADHDYCDIRPFVRQHHVYPFTTNRLFGRPWGRLNQLQRRRDLGELERVGKLIADQINVGGYDVVFANTCRFAFIPTFLPLVACPAIYYLHEPFGPRFVRQFERPFLQHHGWRERVDGVDPLIKLYQRRLDQLQRESIFHTDRLLANSRFTQEVMIESYGVDSQICHYGVNVDGFHVLPDVGKQDFVLSVGELTPRKGFDFVVNSLGCLPAAERPRLKLACNMVNAAEKAYVEELAVQQGVDLEILTNLNSPELAVQYNAARLCVYAPVMEPFGLVPLEAMACETPVVGVREGGVQESVIHEVTGLLVERDPELLATAVSRLLANPELAMAYGRNGRQHVLENWNWEQSVTQLESHLVDCAKTA